MGGKLIWYWVKDSDATTKTWYISLDGEIDIYNAPEFMERLHQLIQRHSGNFVLDCGGLNYIDSTGLGMLITPYDG